MSKLVSSKTRSFQSNKILSQGSLVYGNKFQTKDGACSLNHLRMITFQFNVTSEWTEEHFEEFDKQFIFPIISIENHLSQIPIEKITFVKCFLLFLMLKIR